MTPTLVVMASGEGSNFQALVEASRTGVLNARIAGLLTNRSNIGAITRAETLGIPHKTVAAKAFPSREAWDQAMVDQLQVWGADWVVLAGFLALVGDKVLAAYPRRIVNSHPALLPKFGGAGMYGDHVHRAVVAAGETETGITIHYIDQEYDRGDIIVQERVPVLPGDTAAMVAARVKARENSLYPKVLNDLITANLTNS